MHFDLIFADVMKARGGFDVIVGNPPWAKPSWNEGLVLADIDPLYAGLSASDAKKALGEALPKAPSVRREGRMVPAVEAFLQDFVSTRGAMEVTSSEVMNPFAGGGSNNLYRCFIDLSFRLVAPQGYAALIHQDGHLGDPKSGAFRRHWYGRIAKHFHFRNEMKRKMFAEVHNETDFSLNVYRGSVTPPNFDQVSHAFLPSQVEDSYAHDGLGAIEGIKNSEGKWNASGHRDRVIPINHESLSVIHALSEEEAVPIEEARFIQPYSTHTLGVFREMAKFPKLEAAMPTMERTISTIAGERQVRVHLWQQSPIWNETASQKDGTIQRSTRFRPADQIILQGPLFHVGNPLYKTPRSVCNSNKAYDVIDLTAVPDDYLPRSNYGPAVEIREFKRRISQCRWDPTKSHADFFRIAVRNMIALNGERSLISALLPPGLTHVHGVQSLSFAKDEDLIAFYSCMLSTPFDFLIKAAGKQNAEGMLSELPYLKVAETAQSRALRLACLTSAYADIWNRYANTLEVMPWSSNDRRLELAGSVAGPRNWDRTVGIRSEFIRRMALVEIDVLVAQSLGLSLEQLIEIYRVYFPLMQQYERGTWYDQKGRIVWTNNSSGLPGVGWLDDRGKSPGRAAWEKILVDNPAELTCTATDDTMPGGPRTVTRHFVGPFTQCDRIEDYRRAWAHFERLKCEEAA